MSSRIPLILPCETQVRELDAKLLLASVAAERGYAPIVGSRITLSETFAPGEAPTHADAAATRNE